MANGAKELLDEVATGKVTGEEERYCHTDLSTSRPTSRAREKSYELLKPVAAKNDAALIKELDKQFAALNTLLDKYRDGQDLLRLHLVRQGRQGRAQGALRRGQRARRAAVQARRRRRTHEYVEEPGHDGHDDTTDSTGAADGPGGCDAGAPPSGARCSAGAVPGSRSAPPRPAARSACAAHRRRRRADRRATAGAAVAFHGAHQAGIATAVQDRLHFAAFDVTTDDRAAFIQLLKDWTGPRARMTAGHAVGEGAYGGLAEAPPDDTGEALGLKPSRLTLTLGFGPSLFEKVRPRPDRRPEALVDLPKFPGDNLDRTRSGGDLCVQACADDPQVAVHAIRNLARIGFGKVVDPLVAAGLRQDVLDDAGRPDPAQPVGLQGRHPQHRGHGDGPR